MLNVIKSFITREFPQYFADMQDELFHENNIDQASSFATPQSNLFPADNCTSKFLEKHQRQIERKRRERQRTRRRRNKIRKHYYRPIYLGQSNASGACSDSCDGEGSSSQALGVVSTYPSSEAFFNEIGKDCRERNHYIGSFSVSMLKHFILMHVMMRKMIKQTSLILSISNAIEKMDKCIENNLLRQFLDTTDLVHNIALNSTVEATLREYWLMCKNDDEATTQNQLIMRGL
jgi:hypothetical protein